MQHVPKQCFSSNGAKPKPTQRLAKHVASLWAVSAATATRQLMSQPLVGAQQVLEKHVSLPSQCPLQFPSSFRMRIERQSAWTCDHLINMTYIEESMKVHEKGTALSVKSGLENHRIYKLIMTEGKRFSVWGIVAQNSP